MINHLYLHFPFCRHLCNYCDFYKKVPKSSQEHRDYEQYLDQSIHHLQDLIAKNDESWGELSSVYIGGGTPSLWGVEGAEFLKKYWQRNNIFLAKDCEFTLEVNPGSWTKESIDAWRSIGVNRFSVGAQSLDGRFSKILDRIHRIDEVYETLDYFNSNHDNFSVDFMLGLPFSQEWKRDIEAELEEIFKTNPNHLSLYILTVPKHYIHYEEIPDDEWIADEYLRVAKTLESKKFLHYEVSNFCKPGHHSIHNLAYWQMKTVAALGPSATGFFSSSGHRYKWLVNQVAIQSEVLTPEELRLEKVYMNMRSFEGLDLQELLHNRSDLDRLISKWKAQDYILEHKAKKLVLNSKGYLVLDSLIDELFSAKLL